MGVVITGLYSLCRLRQQLVMRNKRLQADRRERGMRRWKLLPDGTVTTLVEPVEYRFYFFSMARMMMVACLRGSMLMMTAALMARVMTSFVMRVMLPIGLIL